MTIILQFLTLAHPNLSMESRLYDATTESISAACDTDFVACREVLSSLFGVGFRKRFPSKCNVNNNKNNSLSLATFDIIHVVDTSLDEEDESLELDTKVNCA